MSRNSQANRKKKLAKKAKKKKFEQAKKNIEKSKIDTIYLDESGNTGHNIIDGNQRIFTLSACKFSEQEANRLLSLINSNSSKEIHFKNLKRRKSGQDGIIRLMKHSLINKDNVKTSLFHKSYMVTTKIVDTLVEHMFRINGHDLYVNGANIGLSNMWYYCMPTFCGEDRVEVMHSAFISMIKEQTSESIDVFYDSVSTLKDNSIHESFKADLDMLLGTREIIHDALDGIDKSFLDPSIPALFSQCVRWGEVYPKGFHIIHDDSHSIKKKEDLFSQFMDWTKGSVTIGYDRRKIKLPLKGKSLGFGNSEDYPQLQVADVIASSIAYWSDGISRGEKEDYFFLELDKLGLNKLIADKIWPTQEVTPEELGTIHDGGLNAADYAAKFISES